MVDGSALGHPSLGRRVVGRQLLENGRESFAWSEAVETRVSRQVPQVWEQGGGEKDKIGDAEEGRAACH